MTLTGRPHVQGPWGPHAGTLAILSVCTFQPWGSSGAWGGCAHGPVWPLAAGHRAPSYGETGGPVGAVILHERQLLLPKLEGSEDAFFLWSFVGDECLLSLYFDCTVP